MHKMKRIFAIVCTVVLIISFPGCFRQHEYPFGQTMENVASIEIVCFPLLSFPREGEWLRREADATVSPEKYKDFLEEFSQIPVSRLSLDPNTGVCGDAIRITYDDGTVDLICGGNGVHYEQGEWRDNFCVLDREMFAALIEKALNGEYQ